MEALCDLYLCATQARCDSYLCAMQALCDLHLCAMQAGVICICAPRRRAVTRI